MLFVLFDLPRIVGAVDSLLDPTGSARLQRIMPSIVTAVSRTMLGNVVISVVCGTIYGLSAWALGAPFPVALGLIAGFLDLIPMVGATVAGVILALAALTQGVPAAVIMLVVVIVYQQVENYLLQPTILGKRPTSQVSLSSRACSCSERCSARWGNHRRPDRCVNPDRRQGADRETACCDGRL